MRRRTSLDSAESLELLLDTVCNVFGGIIFIAILLSLLTSGQTRTVESRAGEHRSALAAASRAGAVQGQIESLRAGLDELKRMEAAIGTDRASSQSSASEVMDERMASAEERLERARKWLADYEDAAMQGVSDVDAKLAATRAVVSKLEQELGEVSRSKTIKGRLPMARKTSKNQIIVILWKGRAYLYHHHVGGAGEQDVRVEEGLMSTTVTPIAGRGFAADARVERSAEFKAMLAQMEPAKDFADFFVFSDSVDGFTYLRDAMAARGFNYNVHPCEVTNDDGSLRFIHVSSVNVQ